MNSYTTKFPGHIQRFLGAILGTVEILVENDEKNVKFIIDSLYDMLFGGNKDPETLLELIKEYRSLFPYCYMFWRRASRSPKQHLTLWTDELRASRNVTASEDKVNISSGLDAISFIKSKADNMSPKNDLTLDTLASSFSGNRKGQGSPQAEVSLIPSGWDDEEDSIVEKDTVKSYVPSNQSKATTRLRGYNISTSVENINSPTNTNNKQRVTFADSSYSKPAANQRHEQSNGHFDVVSSEVDNKTTTAQLAAKGDKADDAIHDFDDFDDDDDLTIKTSIKSQSPKVTEMKAKQTSPNFSSSPSNEVTIEDLRSIYNANVVNNLGADKM